MGRVDYSCRGGVGVALLGGSPHTSHNDFSHVFYPAGNRALHGRLTYPSKVNPTDVGFDYPPFTALVLAPLAALSEHTAALLWYGLQLGLLLVVSWQLARLCLRDWSPSRALLVAPIFFISLSAFAPVSAELMGGQIDIFILFLLVSSLVLLRNADSTRSLGNVHVIGAGLLLGLATSIKVYPLTFLVIILYIYKDQRLRLAIGAGVALVLSVVLPALLWGITILTEYVRFTSGLDSPAVVAYPFSFSALAIAYRGLAITPFAHPVTALPSATVAASVSAALVLLVILVARLLRHARNVIAWPIALWLTLLIEPLLEVQHVAIIAVVPLVLLADAIGRNDPALIKTLATIIGAATLSGALSYVVPGHPGQLLSFLLGFVAAGFAIRCLGRRGLPWSVCAIGYVLSGTKGMLNFASQWGVPMSFIHVLLGSGEYVALLLTGLPLVFVLPALKRTDAGESLVGQPVSLS